MSNGPYEGASVPAGNPLEPAPPATAELQPPVTLVLTGDQQEALRALWDLMPYFDALASDWYDLLPVEFRKVVER